MSTTNTQSLTPNGNGQGKYTKKNTLNALILSDVEKLSENFEHSEKTTDDILQELSKSIDKIDFKLLAFPNIEDLEKGHEQLTNY